MNVDYPRASCQSTPPTLSKRKANAAETLLELKKQCLQNGNPSCRSTYDSIAEQLVAVATKAQIMDLRQQDNGSKLKASSDLTQCETDNDLPDDLEEFTSPEELHSLDVGSTAPNELPSFDLTMDSILSELIKNIDNFSPIDVPSKKEYNSQPELFAQTISDDVYNIFGRSQAKLFNSSDHINAGDRLNATIALLESFLVYCDQDGSNYAKKTECLADFLCLKQELSYQREKKAMAHMDGVLQQILVIFEQFHTQTLSIGRRALTTIPQGISKFLEDNVISTELCLDHEDNSIKFPEGLLRKIELHLGIGEGEIEPKIGLKELNHQAKDLLQRLIKQDLEKGNRHLWNNAVKNKQLESSPANKTSLKKYEPVQSLSSDYQGLLIENQNYLIHLYFNKMVSNIKQHQTELLTIKESQQTELFKFNCMKLKKA